MVERPPNRCSISLAVFFAFLGAFAFASEQSAPSTSRAAPSRHSDSAEILDTAAPDFGRMLVEQAATDSAWRRASRRSMRMEKITYRSRLGNLDIPAFVFQPLNVQQAKTMPALVWVHENIRGHLYEHYIPYIREAIARGYVVIAPEYRGSIGYGRRLYDAIDYGGAEVDDVISAAGVLTTRYPQVDPERIGIIGWSHGGLIDLLSIARQPTLFSAAAAIVPVSNLIQRIAKKGDRQRTAMDPQNRFGGSPIERRDVYTDRSPLFQVDKFQTPVLVHIADNDQDVNIEEALPLVDALRSRKASLSETKVYMNPPGGHLFDRLVDRTTWRPKNTTDQRDSWNRVWMFFERHLAPVRSNEAAAAHALVH